jgi:hypothetical protein
MNKLPNEKYHGVNFAFTHRELRSLVRNTKGLRLFGYIAHVQVELSKKAWLKQSRGYNGIVTACVYKYGKWDTIQIFITDRIPI